MYHRTLSALAAAAVTAGVLALATPVHAQDAVAVTVSVAGLDLADPADLARFERRVRFASADICGELPARGIQRQGEVASCQEQVVANARADATALAAKQPAGRFRLALRTR